MKNSILIFLFCFTNKILISQTITLQPDATTGIDAVILDDDPTKVDPTSEETIAFIWTRNGHTYEGRSLLKFDLSSLPAGKTITSAKISLYWATLSSAGQAGDNDTKVSRVTSSWDENTVSWNTKPSVSASDFITLPKSSSATQDYIDIDVTSLVTQMYNNQSTNYGFCFEQVVKSTYRSMKFASSDYSVASKRPKLEITFSSCDKQAYFRPDAITGIDALLQENNPTINYGNDEEFITYDWTFAGAGKKGVSLLKFNLASIPTNANIASAKLSLFYNNGSSSAGQFGDNTSYLKKITSSWDENTVTWNTMPSTSSVGQVILPTSLTTYDDYIDFDVLSLISPMVSSPSTNYGMMLQLINSGTYRSMKFCSSDYVDSTRRPRLKICYTASTGISSFSNQQEKSIYPNPASSIIYFYGFNLGEKFSLYNQCGQEVMTGILNDNFLDLKGFAKGIYYFKMEDLNSKFIIN